jgi:lysyl-tRNA synthetase, class II
MSEQISRFSAPSADFSSVSAADFAATPPATGERRTAVAAADDPRPDAARDRGRSEPTDAAEREARAQERLSLLGQGDPPRLWGRLSRIRASSGAVFADLVADGALWQIAALRSQSPEAFEALRACACGDLVEAAGAWRDTRSGDRALFCDRVERRAACLAAFPSWMEPPSEEAASERPELALASDPRRQRWVMGRFRMIAGLRRWADAEGLWEAPTPILSACASGAAATPFETRWRAGGRALSLRVAPENALIRLAMAGVEALYEMGPAFRNEGASRRHHPEFWMIEAYRAGWGAREAMERCQEAIAAACRAAGGQAPGAFAEMGVREALERCALPRALWEDHEALGERLAQAGERPDPDPEARLWQALDALCEMPREPIALTGQPVSISPLAAREGDSARCERFELFVGGMEIANGYAQLRDAAEQRERFAQQGARAGAGMEALAADEAYLRAMELGMPAVGGFGLGVDRLAQWSLGAPTIRHVLAFPLRGA